MVSVLEWAPRIGHLSGGGFDRAPGVLILTMLASCAARVDGPSVRVKPATVEIDSGDNGGFWPPGQAKKERC